jgi:hypothetical protein
VIRNNIIEYLDGPAGLQEPLIEVKISADAVLFIVSGKTRTPIKRSLVMPAIINLHN